MTTGRLVVTGAAGQLGAAFGRLAPDALLWSRSELDITDRAAVMRRIGDARPTVIVNAAAFTNVDGAETASDQAAAVNDAGARFVTEAGALVGAKVIFPSTNFVFSGEVETPYDETNEPDPISVYGRTKAAGETATLQQEGNLVVRTSALYGEGTNFVRAILNAAAERHELKVVDDQVCQPTSSVELARALLDLNDRGATGIFHFAGTPACTWAAFAEAILETAGIDVPVVKIDSEEYAASRPAPTAPRPRRAELDCTKASGAGIEIKDWMEPLHRFVKSI